MENGTVVLDKPTEAAKLVILPLIDGDARVENIAPETILKLYRMTQADGLLSIVFPGVPKVTFGTFVRDLCAPWSYTVVACIDGEIAGYGWLFQAYGEGEERTANLGFCFLKQFWGREEIITLARMTINYWLSQNFRILRGITLESNVLARRFAAMVDAKNVTKLPHYFYRDGELVPAIMFSVERVDE